MACSSSCKQSARLLDLLIITYYQIHIRATLVLIFDSQHSVPVGTPPDWRSEQGTGTMHLFQTLEPTPEFNQWSMPGDSINWRVWIFSRRRILTRPCWNLSIKYHPPKQNMLDSVFVWRACVARQKPEHDETKQWLLLFWHPTACQKRLCQETPNVGPLQRNCDPKHGDCPPR